MLMFGLRFVLDTCLMFYYLDIYYRCNIYIIYPYISGLTSGMILCGLNCIYIQFSYTEDNNNQVNVLKFVLSRGFQTCAFPSGSAHVRELRDRSVGL